MRARPTRLDRLPEQYFTALLARVAAAAAQDGEPLVDLGRGNPDIGPPPHVADALCAAARRSDTHGYAPFAGLPALKEAIAARYRDVYGVERRPGARGRGAPGLEDRADRVRAGLRRARRDDRAAGPGLSRTTGRRSRSRRRSTCRCRSSPTARPDWDAAPREAAALYLNYPSNPVAACAPEGVFEEAIAWAERAGAWVMHDFAYGDLVFDGRRPASFLAVDGAREVGFELFSMSKSYGMAGWRLGFAVGNAEIVARIEDLQNHQFAGIFMPVQEAGVAALTGPQDTVEERRALYEARRDRALAALAGHDARGEGTFFVWFRLPDGVTCERLLEEHRVAVAPGEGFGEQRPRLGAALARDRGRAARPRARASRGSRRLAPLAVPGTAFAFCSRNSRAERLVLVERDRSARDAVVPHAEAHLRLVAEVARDAQRPPGAVRVRPEELDELPPLRGAAPGAEAEPRFDLLPAAGAGGASPGAYSPRSGFSIRRAAVDADLDREHLVLDPVAVPLDELRLALRDRQDDAIGQLEPSSLRSEFTWRIRS